MSFIYPAHRTVVSAPAMSGEQTLLSELTTRGYAKPNFGNPPRSAALAADMTAAFENETGANFTVVASQQVT